MMFMPVLDAHSKCSMIRKRLSAVRRRLHGIHPPAVEIERRVHGRIHGRRLGPGNTDSAVSVKETRGYAVGFAS